MLRLSLFILCFLLLTPIVFAQEENYPGWELNSEYNKLYNYKERDSIKGTLVEFEKVTPLPGMAEGTAFILDEGGERILVHLCPWGYASPQDTGLQKGGKIKVKGCWAVIDGVDVFLAAKVKQGEDFEFKVRLTKDGRPFWTMSQEEREKEGSSL